MTGLTGPQKSLLLGMLTILLVAQAPLPGYTEELSTQSDQVLIAELERMKEKRSAEALGSFELGLSSPFYTRNTELKLDMEQRRSQSIVQGKSFRFAVQIVGYIRRQQKDHVNFVLIRQLLRSGTSIGANVEEAWSWAG